MEYKGLTLDKFQEDAIKSIDKNNSVVVSAPTGAGKTLIADYIINRDLAKGIKVIYTAPIKALSNQKYKEFTKDYGKESVGLLTGDITINPRAPLLIMTTEVYRNMVLSADQSLESISYVVLDEIHYISDRERGKVWEESIIFSRPNVRFLCLSATIPNADELADWISKIKCHKVDVVIHEVRPVPLHRAFYDYELGITTLEKIKNASQTHFYSKGRVRNQRTRAPSHVELVKEIKGQLPCLFFNFSRNNCQRNALELSRAGLFEINKDIISIMCRKLQDAPSEVGLLKSTMILRKSLPYGIGFHHAGLIPVIKDLVEGLFSRGLIKVLYTTETFAVGINMPAKAVCFESLRKFDGINFRYLASKEYFQIAGRAGRRGIDKEGFVYAMVNRRDFDYNRLKQMTDKDIDPIISQFRLSVNTSLNLLKQHSKEEIGEILCKSLYSFQKYGVNYRKRGGIHHEFDNIKKNLNKLGFLRGDELTEKGDFAARIYTDEIIVAEMFATGLYKMFDAFQILMFLACLIYEGREYSKFYKLYPSKATASLKREIKMHDLFKKDKRFLLLDQLTALIYPCFENASVFDIIKNTNMLEGDVIRFLRQILDIIGQIRKATSDRELLAIMDNCQEVVSDTMKGIDVI